MNSHNKLEEVELEIVESKNQVESVIINVLERGDKLEELQMKSDKLVDSANLFTKRAKKVERKMCCQKWTTNAIGFGIAVSVIIFIIILILIFFPNH